MSSQTSCGASAACPASEVPAIALDLGGVDTSAACTDGSKQKEGRRRGRPSLKPKIDIDAEIEEANRLGELFKRMVHLSKVAAKNNARKKKSLLNKAGRLSEDDLMRLAVLKRCGLVVPEDFVDEGVAEIPCLSQPGAAKVTRLSKGSSELTTRMQHLMASTPGAVELLKALESKPGVLSSSASSTRASGCASAASSSASSPTVINKGLKRLPPRRRSEQPPVKAKLFASSTAAEKGEGDDVVTEGRPENSDVEE